MGFNQRGKGGEGLRLQLKVEKYRRKLKEAVEKKS
jgi:hypothetical protein